MTRFSLGSTRLVLSAAVLGVCFAVCRPAKADHAPSLFILPIELGQGAVWTPARPGPVTEANVALLPGALLGQPGTFLGRVSVSALAQLDYRNPDWDLGVGGRLTILLVPILNFVPFKLAAEESYLVRGEGVRIAGGPMFGLGRLLHLSMFYGYETDRKAHVAYVGLGVDLGALGDPVGSIAWYVPKGDGGYGVK